MRPTPPAADLSRLVAIVPVHALEGAKTRLGASLDAEERQALVLRPARSDDPAPRGGRARSDRSSWSAPTRPSSRPPRGRCHAGPAARRRPERGPRRGEPVGRGRRGATAVLILAGDLPAIRPTRSARSWRRPPPAATSRRPARRGRPRPPRPGHERPAREPAGRDPVRVRRRQPGRPPGCGRGGRRAGLELDGPLASTSTCPRT